MGGIVKSIGKAVKKLGKSISKFLKKYRTTIILAAAVWAGLGAFGAASSQASIWSPTSVKHGLNRIFMPAATTPSRWEKLGGLPAQDMSPGWQEVEGSGLMENAAKSTNVLSAIGKWVGGMKDWQKYALTQTGMTVIGSMLDSSAEDELAAKYGFAGIPYGKGPEDPTAIFKEHPEWMVPQAPSATWPAAPSTSQTSTPQQASLSRGPATVGQPRTQQIAAMRTTPLDVRPPGMISGRSQGLIPMAARQRRYA